MLSQLSYTPTNSIVLDALPLIKEERMARRH